MKNEIFDCHNPGLATSRNAAYRVTAKPDVNPLPPLPPAELFIKPYTMW